MIIHKKIDTDYYKFTFYEKIYVTLHYWQFDVFFIILDIVFECKNKNSKLIFNKHNFAVLKIIFTTLYFFIK